MLYSNVKRICDKKGISVGKLEKELGLSNGSISKWRNSTPKYDRLQKIADYFNVSVDFLMNGNENESNTPELTPKDERDIAKSLDHIMNEIRKGDDAPLYYNGIEIDEEEVKDGNRNYTDGFSCMHYS